MTYHSNRRFLGVVANDKIHLSDVQTFFADRGRNEDVVLSILELLDDLENGTVTRLSHIVQT